MVDFVIYLSELKVFKEIKSADLLYVFPLASYEALELLVTLRLKVDRANLCELPGRDGMDLGLLGHDI